MKKVLIVAAGAAAFVVAAVAATLINSVVSALIPGRSPDPPGKLDPSPEEKSKAEWKTQMGESQETKHNTTAAPAPKQEPVTTEEQPLNPAPEYLPEPPKAVAQPTPPRAATGPGNLDAPSYNPPPQVGPGNL